MRITFSDGAWQGTVQNTLRQWVGYTLDVNGKTCKLVEVDAEGVNSQGLAVEWWTDEDDRGPRQAGFVGYEELDRVHVY